MRIYSLRAKCLISLGREEEALKSFTAALSIDPAFRLSFLAVAGILLLAEPLSRSLPLPRPLSGALAISAAAYAATAPFVAWHFGLLAPVGLLTNLAAVPLCALALVSGYACLLLSFLPWLSAACGALAGLAVGALDQLALSLIHI